MQLTVTGGAGFIGRHLVRALLDAGHTVRVLDSLQRASFAGFDGETLSGADCIEGDIRDPAACAKAMAGAQAVVHLAAQSNVMGSVDDPTYCYETNVAGTWHVFEAARASGVEQLVFTSSREVYGEPDRLPVAEDAPLRSKNTYGASKIAGEAILSMGGADHPGVSVLRLTNVVGPGDRDRVIPLWVEAARAGEALRIFGGEQQIDFVPVGTVVECVMRALERGPLDAPVNVGSGRTTTLQALAERVLVAFSRNGTSGSEVQILPSRGPEVARFCADVTRMGTLLGVAAPTDPLAELASFEPAPGGGR